MLVIIFVAYTRRDRSFCRRWRCGPCPEHHRVASLLQTEGAGRATGRDAEINVRAGVRPICVVGWFVSLLRLLV